MAETATKTKAASVAIEGDLADKATQIVGRRKPKITLKEYLSEILRGPIERDYRTYLRDVAKEAAD